MASLTSMTCDDDLRGACSKGWEPPFIGDKEEMERLSKLRKTASLPYIHQRNPSFSYKSKGIGWPYKHTGNLKYKFVNAVTWTWSNSSVEAFLIFQDEEEEVIIQIGQAFKKILDIVVNKHFYQRRQIFYQDILDSVGTMYIVLAIHNEFTINVAKLLFSM